MCRKETILTTRTVLWLRTVVRLIAGIGLCCEFAAGQTSSTTANRAASPWRKLGNHAVAMNLAGPAGGPVAATWFSLSGDRLFVRTRSGQIFETTDLSDFSTWTLTATPGTPQPLDRGFFENTRGPEPNARILLVGSRQFALGANLSMSEDSGQTWTNLTAYRRESVIGSGQHSVAVSPLAVATGSHALIALAFAPVLWAAGMWTSPSAAGTTDVDYVTSLGRDGTLTQVSALFLHYDNLFIGLDTVMTQAAVQSCRIADIVVEPFAAGARWYEMLPAGKYAAAGAAAMRAELPRLRALLGEAA